MPSPKHAFAPVLPPVILTVILTAMLTVSGLTPAFAAAAEDTKLTLAEAVRYALEHSPRLAEARARQEIAGLEESNAKAKLFPTLDLTTSHGLEKSLPGPVLASPAAPVVSQLSLTLSQPLYDNGESWARRDLAALSRETAELTVRKTRDDVLLEVARAYYRLSLTEILYDIKRQQLDLLGKQFRSTDAQYRQGLKTKKDFLRLKSELQRAKVAVEDAEAQRREGVIALQKSIGAHAAENAPGPAFATISAATATKAEPSFPERRPDPATSYLRRLFQLETAVAAKNVELVRRKDGPEVTVGSGVTYANAGYLNSDAAFVDTDSVSWNLLLGVKYNLWDGGTRRRDIEIAEGTKQAREYQMQAELSDLDSDLASLMTTLGGLKASYQLNKELMQLEEESYGHLESEYRQGRVAYLDLITGLSDLLSARVGFYSSYISILEHLAQYRYHEGSLYDHLTAP